MTRRDRNHRDDQDMQRGMSRRNEEERGSMRDQGRVEYYDDQDREHRGGGGQWEQESSGQGQRGRWGQGQSGMNDYGRGYGGDQGDMDQRGMGRRGGMHQDQMDQGSMGQGQRWGNQRGQQWGGQGDQNWGDQQWGGQGRQGSGQQWAQQNWSNRRGQQGGNQGWNERDMGQRWNESWNSGPSQSEMGMDEYGRGFSGHQPQGYAQSNMGRQGDYTRGMGQNWGNQGGGQQWGGQGGMQGPHSGRGPKGYQRSDDRIREDVCEALTQHGHVDASEIEIQVQNGEVTLTGMVDSRQTKRMAEDAIEHLSGVREIHNHLRVGQQGTQQGQQMQGGQNGMQQGQQSGMQHSQASQQMQSGQTGNQQGSQTSSQQGSSQQRAVGDSER